MKKMSKQSDLISNKYTWTIGIDLSTKKVGVVVLSDKTRDRKIKDKRTIDFGGWEKLYQEIKENPNYYFDWYFKYIQELFPYKYCHNLSTNEVNEVKWMLVIELANFSNPSMTQKFAFIAGALISYFHKKIKNLEFKVVNANEWFQHLIKDNPNILKGKSWTKIKREERKKISTKLAKIKDDNQADAYWLAYYAFELKDMWEKEDEK